MQVVSTAIYFQSNRAIKKNILSTLQKNNQLISILIRPSGGTR